MKILVMSDSHGVLSYMETAVKKEKPDIAIHLGDCIGDAERLGYMFPNLRLFSIKGNNDWHGGTLDSVYETEFGKIYMCHGHMLGVKSGVSNLVYTAKSKDCSIALYGHTHRPHLEIIDGVTVVNPGASIMRGSYAICEDGKWSLHTVL
ncbi:MAG: YfcE family phosphodiesterase [Ruminococcaceae bacterium]|nr:YfcE family phosphodiesterase [Oscillospiraceae bacterium]